MFWGTTPALDFLNEVKTEDEEVNILVLGGGDCRHLLLTLARKYCHKNVSLNFYLIETCMENVARQLLLLCLALQPEDSIGLEQKTKIFMEIYGNTIIRPSADKFLINTSRNLIKMITDYDYLHQLMPFVTLNIKYKERDYLENLFKFWCGKDEFNIVEYWDKRLRKFLGVRYDSKIGAFDWDLHMRLHSIGANQICTQEYKNFRLNGIAFTWLESEVSKPNRSLVCAVLSNGDRMLHYGYLGDMQTGPFISFGLSCEDEEFLKSNFGQNTYRSTDVTERNLKQIFYEILHQDRYVHMKTNEHQLGASIIKQEKLIVDVKGVNVDFIRKDIKKCINLQDKIKFLSVSILDLMKFKCEFHNKFDLIYFNSNYMKYFDKDTVNKIIKNNGVILVENPLFVLSNRKKELEEFEKEVRNKIGDLGKIKEEYNCEKDLYMRFIVENKC